MQYDSMDKSKTLLSNSSTYSLNTGKVEYLLKSVLGGGGFGITYLAERTVYEGDIPQTHRYTIKEFFMADICKRNADGSVLVEDADVANYNESRADFLTEANRLHNLHHEGIVPVNEVFEANNTVYYVMQFLGEETLDKYVKKQGQLSESEAMGITREVAEALDYLHDQDMNHLDVKPENIMMVKKADGIQHPVLIDFGLSLHFKKNGSVTNKKAGLGTSDGYSPLEQYAGITKFSPTADVYALGATLLYMLTGRTPAKASEMSQKYIINALPDSTSERCSSLIIDAMKKNADERMASMGGFIETSSNGNSYQSYSSQGQSHQGNKTKKMTKKIKGGDDDSLDVMDWVKKIGIGLAVVVVLYLSYRVIRFVIVHPNTNKTEQTDADSTQTQKDSTAIKQQEMQDKKNSEDANQNNSDGIKTKSDKTDESGKANKNSESTDITKPVKPTPAAPAVEHSTSYSGTLDLGYAVWTGYVKNGKPDGQGTLRFKRSHRIEAFDPDGNVAEAGDVVKGSFSNGHMEHGTWIKTSGEKVKLLIGQ